MAVVRSKFFAKERGRGGGDTDQWEGSSMVGTGRKGGGRDGGKGGLKVTRELLKMDGDPLFLETIDEELALSGFAGSVEAFYRYQGTPLGLWRLCGGGGHGGVG